MGQQEIRKILDEVAYPGHSFRVGALAGGACFLQITYAEEDVETGQLEEQRGRKWYLSEHATTRGEVVQTALKAALTSAEHRVREHFTYQGERVFGPHFDLDALVQLARAGRTEKRPAAPDWDRARREVEAASDSCACPGGAHRNGCPMPLVRQAALSGDAARLLPALVAAMPGAPAAMQEHLGHAFDAIQPPGAEGPR